MMAQRVALQDLQFDPETESLSQDSVCLDSDGFYILMGFL